MSEVKTIRLYGKLGARFGRVHRMAVSNTAEAVQALCSQYPGFEQFLTEAKDNGMVFTVFAGKKNLKEENLKDPVGDEDIRIAPVMIGSKSQGIFTIIVGIVLIIVGAILIWTGIGGPLGTYLIQMGVGMIIGGVVQLLMPVPKAPESRDRPDANASYTFNGPINTQAQGNPVPVLYGRMTVGSAVISAGIVANQTLAGGNYGGTGSVSGGGHYTDATQYVV